MLFCRLLLFQNNLSKYSFRNTIRVSNRFDPDQVQPFVGPDLGPNCLQRLSADDTSRQRVKGGFCIIAIRITLNLETSQFREIKTLAKSHCRLLTEVNHALVASF